MLLKPAYNKNMRCTNGWEPWRDHLSSINNRSSVGFNILNHNDNKTSGVVITGIFDKKLCNKKKGIAEFEDLNHLTAPKTNPDF